MARLLTTVERDPQARWRDRDVRRLAIDPARARRYFTKHYGMTFQAYCRGRRMNEALVQIKRGERLDDVALGNGYDSHSGFREAFARTFGQPPGKGRHAGCVVGLTRSGTRHPHMRSVRMEPRALGSGPT